VPRRGTGRLLRHHRALGDHEPPLARHRGAASRPPPPLQRSSQPAGTIASWRRDHQLRRRGTVRGAQGADGDGRGRTGSCGVDPEGSARGRRRPGLEVWKSLLRDIKLEDILDGGPFCKKDMNL
jgi:hypothetical protein